MSHVISILIAILVFGIIIAIHEFGHFIVAKWNGIQVNQFAIGMGPRILHFQKGETEYSLRLFPIGGFCAMEGEDTDSENPRAFHRKKPWRRMTVVLAGAAMNILLGFVLLCIMACMMTKIPTTTVAEFYADEDGTSMSQSEQCGLQVGDKIIGLNGSHIFTTTDLVYILRTNETDTYDVTVRRDGGKIVLEDVQFHNDETDGLLDFKVTGEKKNLLTVCTYAAEDTLATGKLIWQSLLELVTGKYGIQDLSGPVGTVSVIEQAASAGETFQEKLESVMELTIFITINVGMFNLLPIPGLDGSRFWFLVVEAIRRKPVPQEKEAMVHFIGLALMFVLMIVVTVGDVSRLFTGG